MVESTLVATLNPCLLRTVAAPPVCKDGLCSTGAAICPSLKADFFQLGSLRDWSSKMNFPIPGSTISTLLHDRINPKDCQVLSLGDTGFLQFFRVVSRDYGKPRIRFYLFFSSKSHHF